MLIIFVRSHDILHRHEVHQNLVCMHYFLHDSNHEKLYDMVLELHGHQILELIDL